MDEQLATRPQLETDLRASQARLRALEAEVAAWQAKIDALEEERRATAAALAEQEERVARLRRWVAFQSALTPWQRRELRRQTLEYARAGFPGHGLLLSRRLSASLLGPRTARPRCRPRASRARRARPSVRSGAASRDGPDPDPEPDLDVVPLARFVRAVGAWLGVNVCAECELDFASVEAFDRHRVGAHAYSFAQGLDFDPPREDGRRCLDEDELGAMGWLVNGRGCWHDPLRSARRCQWREQHGPSDVGVRPETPPEAVAR